MKYTKENLEKMSIGDFFSPQFDAYVKTEKGFVSECINSDDRDSCKDCRVCTHGKVVTLEEMMHILNGIIAVEYRRGHQTVTIEVNDRVKDIIDKIGKKHNLNEYLPDKTLIKSPSGQEINKDGEDWYKRQSWHQMREELGIQSVSEIIHLWYNYAKHYPGFCVLTITVPMENQIVSDLLS